MQVRRLDELPASTAEAPGVAVRKLLRYDDVELKVLDVAPRCATPFHTHVHAHEGVVVAGVGALRLEHGREELAPGDVFSVAAQQPHAIACHGDEPLRFVCLDCMLE